MGTDWAGRRAGLGPETEARARYGEFEWLENMSSTATSDRPIR